MKLAYSFSNRDLLAQAFTHKSASAAHNERLEFLGDTLLDFFISEYLYQQFPEATEGQLSRFRALLVNQESLAEVARQLDLGPHLQLGSGELKSGGRQKASLLADAVEALIAAIYLDSDLNTCRHLVLDWFSGQLESLSLGAECRDAKSALQEWLQARHYPLPEYDVLEQRGPDNDCEFTVRCRLHRPQQELTAVGRSKKQAEQLAAQKMMQYLLAADHPSGGRA